MNSLSAEDMARLAWGCAPALSARKKSQLHRVVKDYRELLFAPEHQWARLPVPPITRRWLHQWRCQPEVLPPEVRAGAEWLQLSGHSALMPGDDGWPERLHGMEDPPLPLYLDGDMASLSAPLVAIVGSRKPSTAGRESAYRLAAELAGLGFGVISGLAGGIDTAAHLGALDNEGRTLAVMATGPEQVYPAQNRQLAERIRQSGVILTAYRVGSELRKYHFIARNGIIAALARAVLVVEAGQRSGSLSTARFAAERGGEVMAMPGPVRGGKYAGCHQLIRNGAALVEDSLQVLECMGVTPDESFSALKAAGDKETPPPGLDSAKLSLWQQLGQEPLPADILAVRLTWPVERVMSLLSELEVLGIVYREVGGYIRAG